MLAPHPNNTQVFQINRDQLAESQRQGALLGSLERGTNVPAARPRILAADEVGYGGGWRRWFLLEPELRNQTAVIDQFFLLDHLVLGGGARSL